MRIKPGRAHYIDYKVDKCNGCLFVKTWREHGGRSWSCSISDDIGFYGYPPKYVHQDCPLMNGPVTVKVASCNIKDEPNA